MIKEVLAMPHPALASTVLGTGRAPLYRYHSPDGPLTLRRRGYIIYGLVIKNIMQNLKRSCILYAVCCMLFIAVPSINAAVDVYLAPTRAATIIGGNVTYNMFVQADVDTRLEALGDIFMAYDKDRIRLVTASVEDLAAARIKWTDSIASLDYKGGPFLVSENIGIIRFAKVSLHEKMFLTANVPVEIYRLPFEIIPSASFSMTRLYFLKALMIDDKHKNVLRNAADSFLIKQIPSRKSLSRRS